MEESPYSKREQDTRHQQIVTLLTDIKFEVTDISVRVSKLEDENAERRGASGTLKVVLGIAVAVLIGYLGWIGMEISRINITLSAYDISVE